MPRCWTALLAVLLTVGVGRAADLCGELPAGTECDDGDACTQVDVCIGGVCRGTDPVVCTASDQCHEAGDCDPATGLCSDPARADTSSCDDGDACTQVDVCLGGVCTGSDPVVCTASDGCHMRGTCDPASGLCSNPARPDEWLCDDGDACTQLDICLGGVCTGTVPVLCSASDQCHDAGVCDHVTGFCSDPAMPDASPCDDGDACTRVDVCLGGLCTGGNSVICTARDQCHTPGTCDPASGLCSDPPKPDASPCNDGDACTRHDTCTAGVCTGADPVVCTALDQCHDAGMCDPASGHCSEPARPDASPCDDHDACTRHDTCTAGVCTGADPVTCTALDQCHDAGTCDPASGHCSEPARPDASPCDDHDACTRHDACTAGVCTGADPVTCTALDQCHDAGMCDPATGHCSEPARPDASPCDDHDACTRHDTCTAGVCTGADPVTCTALDQCHDAGTCDPASGHCSEPARPDASPCDDHDACTRHDTCTAGVCTGADPVVCTALDQCHDAGTCDPASGHCSEPARPDASPCDDHDACTRHDTCTAGVCTGADPVTCTALDQCHDAGTCDPASGHCSEPARPDASPCDDHDACTRHDTCTAGVCTGADPVTCTALDQCHDAGTCDPASGHCSEPARPDASPCDDHDACTRHDTCTAGVCSGADPVACTAIDECHDPGTCDPGSGRCSTPVKLDGTLCNDGRVCTAADVCRGGTCGGVRIAGCCVGDADCDDGVDCTEDRCATGTCVHLRMDERCGPGAECTRATCAPESPGAGADGCLVRPTNEGQYCAEDGDPCSTDLCRAAVCTHHLDGDDPACPDLDVPFRTALELLMNADGVRIAVATAAAKTCPAVSTVGCEIVTGSNGPSDRLLALLASVHTDVQSVTLALGGRLADPSAAQLATVRARLALTLIADTPGALRGFRATLARGRATRTVSPGFARVSRSNGAALLRATRSLRNQLRRVLRRSMSFAR